MSLKPGVPCFRFFFKSVETGHLVTWSSFVANYDKQSEMKWAAGEFPLVSAQTLVELAPILLPVVSSKLLFGSAKQPY